MALRQPRRVRHAANLVPTSSRPRKRDGRPEGLPSVPLPLPDFSELRDCADQAKVAVQVAVAAAGEPAGVTRTFTVCPAVSASGPAAVHCVAEVPLIEQESPTTGC